MVFKITVKKNKRSLNENERFVGTRSKDSAKAVFDMIDNAVERIGRYPNIEVEHYEGEVDQAFGAQRAEWDEHTDFSSEDVVEIRSTISLSDLGLSEKPLPNYLPARMAEKSISDKLDKMFPEPAGVYNPITPEFKTAKGSRPAKGNAIDHIAIRLASETLDVDEGQEVKNSLKKLDKAASAFSKNHERIKNLVKQELMKYVYNDSIPEEVWVELRSAERSQKLNYREQDALRQKVLSKYIK